MNCRPTSTRTMQGRVLAILILLVGGCVSPEQARDGENDPPGDTVRVFVPGAPTKVAPVPNNQIEAVVSVSPDGRVVLTCFHGLFTETSPGYASTDGGVSWKRMAFPAHAGPGGDCETAILEDGSWAFLASTVAGATVLVSRDAGATWTVNNLAALPVNGLADRPWLEAVGNELWLAYMPLNFQPGTIAFTKSKDHGATWSVPIHIGTPGPDTVVVRHGHFAVGNGTVWLPMVRGEPADTAPRTVQIASTKDGGLTWQTRDIHKSTTVVGDWPSLARTEANDLIFLVTGRAPSNHRSILALYQADGGAWSEPELIHDGGGGFGAEWPWIAGGNGRNATFIVEGAFHNDTKHLWMGRIDAGTRRVEQWPLMGRTGVEFASVDHDAQGNAYAVWVASGDAQYFLRATLETRPATPHAP